MLSCAFLLAGCSGLIETSPIPTPADWTDLSGVLAKSGIAIEHAVSGDAGCTDTALIPTAISIKAHGLDQPSTVTLYLYVFRDHDTFERLRTTVDACARSYVTDPDTYQSIDQSPFVLTGQGPWGPKFEAAIRAALETAAGNGG